MTGALTPAASTLRDDQRQLGLWMFLGTVTMLFAAFASAYIVRQSGSDWQHVSLPSILWLNTVVLVVSSVTLEIAAHYGRQRQWATARMAFGAAFLLGLGFLRGQISAWQNARAAGIYVPTNPHASFFYILTGAHAVHVVAALTVLAWGLALVGERKPDAHQWDARISICRTFWHYLGGVWVFLFALMSLY
jgi:cytochrome c oxidase subunit 3